MLSALAALLVVQILFAALPVASKFVLDQANPLFVVVLRSAFGALFFYVLQQFFKKQKSGPEQRLNLSTHLRLAVLAFFGITFNQVALFVALPHTSASIASIVSPTIAIFTLVFSVWAGRERFEMISVTSVTLGALGVAMVLFPGFSGGPQSVAPSSGVMWANALNVISAASYAFYLARVDFLPSQIGTFRFMFFIFFYGLLMNILCWLGFAAAASWGVLSAEKGLTLSVGVSELGLPFWSGLVFLLVGATAITYVLNAWALQKVQPSLVGGFVCLQTVFGLFFSGLILRESLTPMMIFGSVSILTGVLLLSLVAHFRRGQDSMSASAFNADLKENSEAEDYSVG